MQIKRLIECKNGDDSFGCFSDSCDAADADGGVGGVALKTKPEKHTHIIIQNFPFFPIIIIHLQKITRTTSTDVNPATK